MVMLSKGGWSSKISFIYENTIYTFCTQTLGKENLT